MKKTLCLILTLCLTACFDPISSPPQLHPSTLISSTSTEFKIEGRNLFPVKVLIGTQNASILETDPTGAWVKVKIANPLKTGTYSLRVDNSDLSATVKAGIGVLNTTETFPESEYNLETSPRKYILDGGGLLAFKPDLANRTAVLDAITRAGFSITQTQEPLVPGSKGVCGQTMVLLSDNIASRSVIESLNALQRSLESLEPGVVFDLNAKFVVDSPSAGISQNITPDTSTPAPKQPRAIPADLHLARVAVIDSGTVNHPIFSIGGTGNLIDFAAARNFTKEGDATDVTDLATERNAEGTLLSPINNVGHGTAVAGMVGATILNTFSPGATLYTPQMDKLIVPIKACEGSAGRCRNSSVILGVCYAISLNSNPNPVKVINLSLGSKYPSSMLLSALNDASERGMTIVTSAGNKGTDASRPPNYPANFSLTEVGSYDAIPGLISVASVEPVVTPVPNTYQASGFSSIAASVTISGIGVVKAVAANQLFPDINALKVFSGTSFSAPQVSAAASLYYAKYVGMPDINPIAFKQKLIASAIPPSAATAPFLQPCAPEKCGAGMLNIAGILTP
jgi:Subtilase family